MNAQCRLNNSSHHFWVGFLLHPLKSGDWKWSTDKCAFIIKGLLKKSMWTLNCGKRINKHHIVFWKNQLNFFENQDLTQFMDFVKSKNKMFSRKIVLKNSAKKKSIIKEQWTSFPRPYQTWTYQFCKKCLLLIAHIF